MKKILSNCICLLFILASCSSDQQGLPKLIISENQRFLATTSGDPFFWLGDTGWLLFTKLSREEALEYFANRQQKGFNVIQVMLLHDVKRAVNIYGDSALIRHRVDQPLVTPGDSFDDEEQYDYWDHVEYLVDLAAQYGLYMALVPVWGSNVRSGRVSREQAETYAAWLAESFRKKSNVVWLNGGYVKGSDSTEVWNAIGNVLHHSCPDQLVSFHPFGRTQSSAWFHEEEWLDFNMVQSGHRRYDQDTSGLAYGEDNYRYIQADYARLPTKPVLDGEPSYEGIPQGLHDPTQPYWTDDDVRRYAYWSVFAGGCGFTYGHNAVMQFYEEGDPDPAYGVKVSWREAIDAPGATQLIFLKQLLDSVSYFDRIPAQDLLLGGSGQRYDYVAATQGSNYALFYTYDGNLISVNHTKVPFGIYKSRWYDPRDGSYSRAVFSPLRGDTLTFDPPGEKENGNDWVLILEGR